MATRISKYKNQSLDSQELRRRREEVGVQIRKTKREEQVSDSCFIGNCITYYLSY